MAVVVLALTSPAFAATTIPSKEMQAEVTTQFSLWLAKTFTKCGSSYFAKSYSNDSVYEFVGPKLAMGGVTQTVDELNHITTVSVPLQFSAIKSRMSARPSTLLWIPGLRRLLRDGSVNAEVTATRVNNDWYVKPGSWYYRQRFGPIDCDQLPSSIAPPDQSATVRLAEPEGASSPTPPPPKASPVSDGDWYVLAALACEPRAPSDILALGKVLGLTMRAQDVKEGGRIVATTISGSDGSSARFYRGKVRCQTVLQREANGLDRYK
jgi:hypothetical protein